MKLRLRRSLRSLLASFVVFASLLAPLCSDAAAQGLRAELRYQEEGKNVRVGGEAAVSGKKARLDSRLGKAGLFTLLVDREAGKMQVLSHRLKGYVETHLDGEARSWRDLVRSASAVLMPQTFGLVSFDEKSCKELGRERVEGYEAVKSHCVFTLGFMGAYRDIAMDVWEGPDFAPFPLKVVVIGDHKTRGAEIWFSGIQAMKGKGDFHLPEGYTRFGSVLDLILFALSQS